MICSSSLPFRTSETDELKNRNAWCRNYFGDLIMDETFINNGSLAAQFGQKTASIAHRNVQTQCAHPMCKKWQVYSNCMRRQLIETFSTLVKYTMWSKWVIDEKLFTYKRRIFSVLEFCVRNELLPSFFVVKIAINYAFFTPNAQHNCGISTSRVK